MKETIAEKIIDLFRSGSPLTFAQTRRQIYGLPIHRGALVTKRLKNNMDRLRKQGWLAKKVKEDQVFYILTAKGRVKQLSYKLRVARMRRGEHSTIIIFDIPEEKRKYRNFFRRLLREMKFTMIQKSVLIAPYVLPEEFYDLLKELNLLQYVKVIEGDLRF